MQSQGLGRGADVESLISYDAPRRRRPELVDASASMLVALQRDRARSQSPSALQIVPAGTPRRGASEVHEEASQIVSQTPPQGPTPPRLAPTTPGRRDGATIQPHVSDVLAMMSSRKVGNGKKRRAPEPSSDDDSDESNVAAATPPNPDGAGTAPGNNVGEATAASPLPVAPPLPVVVGKKKAAGKETNKATKGKQGNTAKAGKGADAAGKGGDAASKKAKAGKVDDTPTAATAKATKNDKKVQKAKAGTAADAATATATTATHDQGDKVKIPYKDLIVWDGSYEKNRSGRSRRAPTTPL